MKSNYMKLYITIWSPEKFSFVVIFKLGEITDILCVDENSQQRNKQWGWERQAKMQWLCSWVNKSGWNSVYLPYVGLKLRKRSYVYMIMREKAQIQRVTCFVNWNLQKLISDYFYFIQIEKQVSGLRQIKNKKGLPLVMQG